MESEYAHLADTIILKAKSHPKPRFLVAIAGAPGSGKTTTAKTVQQQLNDNKQLLPSSQRIAFISHELRSTSFLTEKKHTSAAAHRGRLTWNYF